MKWLNQFTPACLLQSVEVMLRVLRVRVLVILALIYLSLIGLIYHFLWKSHGLDNSIDSLFDSPGQGNSPQVNDDIVQFNFKRGKKFNFALQDNTTLPPTNLTSSHAPNNSLPRLELPPPLFGLSELSPPNYCIHAFYYMWYGNEVVDGQYMHWNHQYLPHWKPEITNKYPKGRHKPPDDIGASFYPEMGPYSSRDPLTMEKHMYQLRQAGVGVVSVSWYPRGIADDEGGPPDELIPQLLNTALRYSVKVTLHIEPYKNRTPLTVKNDLEYLHKQYAGHPAYYKLSRQSNKDPLPLVYVYDSYLSPAKDWGQVLTAEGADSIRGGELDAIVIGLLVEERHKQAIVQAGFDGFYTYFASDRFSYGSTVKNWRGLAKFAHEKGLIFIPSFGPGYNDERVRPWNKSNSKPRQNGGYYRKMFEAAVSHAYLPEHRSKVVSLTSFNEWHEGTQIEPAVPKVTGRFTYLDYRPHEPSYYLELTREGSTQLECSV